jgi:hypothetical protein
MGFLRPGLTSRRTGRLSPATRSQPEGLKEAWIAHLLEACYADFTAGGLLDIFDFLAFMDAFHEIDSAADCDGNIGLDLFDSLCFVNAFSAGC